MKNINYFFILISILFFFSCETTKKQDNSYFDFLNEEIESTYIINNDESIVNSICGTWYYDDSPYSNLSCEISFFKDGTFFVRRTDDEVAFIGIYYIYQNNQTHLQLYSQFIIEEELSLIRNTYYLSKTKSQDIDSNFIISIVDNKFGLYYGSHNREIGRTFFNEGIYHRIRKNPTLQERTISNNTKLKQGANNLKFLREEAKAAFLNRYKNSQEEFNKRIRDNEYKLKDNKFTVFSKKPESWPSHLISITDYNWVHPSAREIQGEYLQPNTAYRVICPSKIVQWIDNSTVLIEFLYSNTYSDVYWGHTDKLGNIYNSRSLSWGINFYDGTQLFFEYLGEKVYTTQNGFRKVVPEIKFFYHYYDESMENYQFTIEDPYEFIEILGFKYQ